MGLFLGVSGYSMSIIISSVNFLEAVGANSKERFMRSTLSLDESELFLEGMSLLLSLSDAIKF